MHVLVTADAIGGVWTYTRELVIGLARRGARITLVSFGEIPSHSQTEWLNGVKNVDFRATAFKLEWMRDSKEDLRLSSEFLLDVINEVKPDLLHLSQYCYGAMQVPVPKIVVAHSDVVSWWVAVHGHEPPDENWIRDYREVVSAGIHGADVVVAPSRWMLEQVVKHYGQPARGAVIYNGRNPGLFNPHTSKVAMVAAVGRIWDQAKNIGLLLQAHPKTAVWIAGTESHPEESLRDDNVSKAVPGIRFCGRQSEAELRQLFSRASIYAATSQYEPFGLAPVEAAFSRCAILANDIPSFREVWGETAFYFRRNDADDLNRAVARLQGDAELRLQYANLAYRRARERYTAERMVTEYMGLYQTLVPAGAAVA